jgi:hypothetical protein
MALLIVKVFPIIGGFNNNREMKDTKGLFDD